MLSYRSLSLLYRFNKHREEHLIDLHSEKPRGTTHNPHFRGEILKHHPNIRYLRLNISAISHSRKGSTFFFLSFISQTHLSCRWLSHAKGNLPCIAKYTESSFHNTRHVSPEAWLLFLSIAYSLHIPGSARRGSVKSAFTGKSGDRLVDRCLQRSAWWLGRANVSNAYLPEYARRYYGVLGWFESFVVDGYGRKRIGTLRTKGSDNTEEKCM